MTGVERIVCRASVAHADVEVAVGADGERAAVVVAEGLIDCQQRNPVAGSTSGVEDEGVDRGRAAEVGEVDVEGLVVDGETEQAALTAGGGLIVDVEHDIAGDARVGIDDEHLTRALSDPPLAVWGDDGIDRLDEPYERVEFDCGLVDVADRRR